LPGVPDPRWGDGEGESDMDEARTVDLSAPAPAAAAAAGDPGDLRRMGDGEGDAAGDFLLIGEGEGDGAGDFLSGGAGGLEEAAAAAAGLGRRSGDFAGDFAGDFTAGDFTAPGDLTDDFAGDFGAGDLIVFAPALAGDEDVEEDAAPPEDWRMGELRSVSLARSARTFAAATAASASAG
jgi:hypothetical protein